MTRIARIVAGFGLLAAGTLMLFLPGPGIVTIIAGLALLAKEVKWADRLKRRLSAGVGIDREPEETGTEPRPAGRPPSP
ncbi:MAG: PGPGW domain-containing protein [Acidimicrobiia bacterium]|nr:PGPGW domain-containing protein [Acidimicrobiia bacterium]